MTFHNVFSFVKCSDVYKSFDDIASDYFCGKINLIEGLVVSFHSEGKKKPFSQEKSDLITQ